MEIRWPNRVLHNLAVRQHPAVQFVPEEITLRPISPRCSSKPTAFCSFGTTNRKWHGVNDHFFAEAHRTSRLLEQLQQTLNSHKGLSIGRKIWSPIPKNVPPHRRVRVFEHQTRQMERDQMGIRYFLVFAPFSIAKMFACPAVKGADDMTTA